MKSDISNVVLAEWRMTTDIVLKLLLSWIGHREVVMVLFLTVS